MTSIKLTFKYLQFLPVFCYRVFPGLHNVVYVTFKIDFLTTRAICHQFDRILGALESRGDHQAFLPIMIQVPRVLHVGCHVSRQDGEIRFTSSH